MPGVAILRACLCSLSICAFAALAVADTAGDNLQMTFNNACRTCHSPRADDHRLGPSLHGVIGRKAGSIAGYNFSSAMKSSGVTWDEASLDQFIANPDQVVHGNNMKPYTGISDAKQRGDIVAYLKTLK